MTKKEERKGLRTFTATFREPAKKNQEEARILGVVARGKIVEEDLPIRMDHYEDVTKGTTLQIDGDGSLVMELPNGKPVNLRLLA